jgi:hypothetical protein
VRRFLDRFVQRCRVRPYFAADPIASRVFSRIQGRVGTIEQVRNLGVRWHERGQPDRNRELNSITLCDPAQGITLACPRQKLDALASFFDPGNPQPEVYRNRYTNNIRPTDSGIYGYKIGFCVQDLYGQTGADGQTLKTPWKRQSPKPESCFEETFICGAGSKDPRNDPSHPEYDPASQTHSYGCITDAVAFGAKPEVDGKDKASHQDNDAYSVDDYH